MAAVYQGAGLSALFQLELLVSCCTSHSPGCHAFTGRQRGRHAAACFHGYFPSWHQHQDLGAGDRFFKAFAGGHQCSKFEQQRRSVQALPR